MFSLRADDEVSLELAEMHHAQQIFELVDRNREHLAPWMPWVDGTTTVADTTAFLTFIRGEYGAGRALHCNLRYRDEIVGGIGLHHANTTDRTVEVGYWVSAEHVGKGVVTRATRALVDALFGQGYVRVSIKAATDNARSRAVPERLGFTFEGVERAAAKVNGRHVDHAVYSMLAEEWGAGRLAG